jgi:ornithine cyclodeaminase
LIEGRWLRAGSHLDLIGSFTPAMREADDACFAGARLYVDTEEALRKSGDLLGRCSAACSPPTTCAAPSPRWRVARRAGDAATPSARCSSRSGTALEDLAAAILVYERG